MLTQSEFSVMLDAIIAREFPKSRLAFEQERDDLVERLYRGEAMQILSPAKGNSDKSNAEFQFDSVTTLAVVTGAVPVLNLMKTAAETFLSMQKVRELQAEQAEKAQMKQENTAKAEREAQMRLALQDELQVRLTQYLPKEKAAAVAMQVASAIAAHSPAA